MNTPQDGEIVESILTSSLDDKILDDFYSQMSEYIDTLLTEMSQYTPVFADSFFMLRSGATKIFQNFIGDIRGLIDQTRTLDANMEIQGKLFEYE